MNPRIYSLILVHPNECKARTLESGFLDGPSPADSHEYRSHLTLEVQLGVDLVGHLSIELWVDDRDNNVLLCSESAILKFDQLEVALHKAPLFVFLLEFDWSDTGVKSASF